jgi:hypothetical protein
LNFQETEDPSPTTQVGSIFPKNSSNNNHVPTFAANKNLFMQKLPSKRMERAKN